MTTSPWLLAVALLATTPADEAAEKEARAFEAIDDERWCSAAALFLEADAAGPDPRLVENAARAAEIAGDLAAARSLYERLLDDDAHGAKARARLLSLDAPSLPHHSCGLLPSDDLGQAASATPASAATRGSPGQLRQDGAVSPWPLVGGAAAGTGVLCAVATTAALLWLELAVASNPSAKGEDRARAQAIALPVLFGGAMSSGGLIVGGLGLATLSWLARPFEEEENP